MFVKTSKKWLTIAKALAYCTTELITGVKSFMIQGPGLTASMRLDWKGLPRTNTQAYNTFPKDQVSSMSFGLYGFRALWVSGSMGFPNLKVLPWSFRLLLTLQNLMIRDKRNNKHSSICFISDTWPQNTLAYYTVWFSDEEKKSFITSVTASYHQTSWRRSGSHSHLGLLHTRLCLLEHSHYR